MCLSDSGMGLRVFGFLSSEKTELESKKDQIEEDLEQIEADLQATKDNIAQEETISGISDTENSVESGKAERAGAGNVRTV